MECCAESMRQRDPFAISAAKSQKINSNNINMQEGWNKVYAPGLWYLNMVFSVSSGEKQDMMGKAVLRSRTNKELRPLKLLSVISNFHYSGSKSRTRCPAWDFWVTYIMYTIQNCEVYLRDQRIVLPFRGTSTGRRSGLTELHEVQQRETPSPTPGEE